MLLLFVSSWVAAAEPFADEWCATLLRDPPPPQPCWDAAELKRRSRVPRSQGLDAWLRAAAVGVGGEPIWPSEGGQDRWMWEHHLKWIVDRPITYADFGSNHFLHTSNTFFLDACVGARGVCVEASASYLGAYEQHGRRCQLVSECLSDTRETVAWAEYGGPTGGHTRSGVLATNKSYKRRQGNVAHVAVLNKTCTTGAEVFARHKTRHVDWLDLDAEGNELAILRGIDWTDVQIDVVTSESNDEGVRDFLTRERGYRLATKLRIAPRHFDDLYTRAGFELAHPEKMAGDACVGSVKFARSAEIAEARGKLAEALPRASEFAGAERLGRRDAGGRSGRRKPSADTPKCPHKASPSSARCAEIARAAAKGGGVDEEDAWRSGRWLRCELKLNAGFGFRFGALNGCLLAALALNATLIFDNDALYRERADFGIDPNTFDELLRLNRALPTAHDVAALRSAKCLRPFIALPGPAKRASFERWWARHGAEVAASTLADECAFAKTPHLYSIQAQSADRGRLEGLAPFLSHDYSATSQWLRAALVAATARRNGTMAELPLFRSGALNVAVHVRNGDRLPGRSYEKNAALNLPDEWYFAAVLGDPNVAAIARAAPASSDLHVALMGASIASKREQRHESLRDAFGNESALPAFVAARARVASHVVVIDNDSKSDLAHFSAAQVFVAARSQFSFAAMALSRGVVVRPGSFRPHKDIFPSFDAGHAASCHVNLHDDLRIDHARLARALRDPRCDNRRDLPPGALKLGRPRVELSP